MAGLPAHQQVQTQQICEFFIGKVSLQLDGREDAQASQQRAEISSVIP